MEYYASDGELILNANELKRRLAMSAFKGNKFKF